MTEDLTPIIRVPHPIEIVGLVAACLPFMASSATSSMSTYNGEVIDFYYRDWIAITGGGIALVCAAISLLMLVRTQAKAKRLGIAMALLVGGSVQAARGVGVFAAPHAGPTFRSIPSMETRPTRLKRAVSEQTIDTLAFSFEANWRKGDLETIYREAHPELAKVTSLTDMQRAHLAVALGFGKLIKRTSTVTHSVNEPHFIIEGGAIFERGTLDLRLEYKRDDRGLPRLIFYNLKVPEQLRRPVKVEDADAIARAFVESLIAGRLDTSRLDPEILTPMTADSGSLISALEHTKIVGPPTVRTCEVRCLTFAIKGSSSGTVEVSLGDLLDSWLIQKVAWSLK